MLLLSVFELCVRMRSFINGCTAFTPDQTRLNLNKKQSTINTDTHHCDNRRGLCCLCRLLIITY